MSVDDDLQWMRAAAAGDREAFGRVVRHHQRAVFCVALRVVRDDEALARDICQQSFLSAWLHRDGFEFRSSVRTWLLRITTHLALNELRRPHRRHEQSVDEDEGVDRLEPASTAPLADHHLDVLRQHARVDRALATLPPRQRAVAALRLGEDLDFSEIAEVLGITPTNAKATFHLAVEKIRRVLTARGEAA